jgi:hypothetical protein
MIFLEEATHQALAEEGQTIITLSDLEISWEMINSLFFNTYNQAKQYVPIYKWTTRQLTPHAIVDEDIINIKHITYNAYQNMQRFMPDIEQQTWEFNPYTKEIKGLVSTSYSLEYNTYSYCGQLPYAATLRNLKQGRKYAFYLPCMFSSSDFTITGQGLELEAGEPDEDGVIALTGSLGSGTFDVNTLSGFIEPNINLDSIELKLTSKYYGILELDMTCELFFTWYKANLLALIASMKEQIDLQGVGLPFDINKDGLVARARQLRDEVENAKINKAHWWSW